MAPRVENIENGTPDWSLPPFLAELAAREQSELVVDLLDAFLDDTAMRLKALEGAWNRQDRGAVRQQAHALKGSCRQVGADSMALLCEQMEAAAQGGCGAGGPVLLRLLLAQWAPLRDGVAGCRDSLRTVKAI